MKNVTRLTLKDLTLYQRSQLNARFASACKEHGVSSATLLPETVRVAITRETMDKFSAEREAAVLAAERARTSAAPVADVKTFTWRTTRRR